MIEREFGALDIDRILRNADQQMARAGEFQQVLQDLTGHAQDEDGFVTAECGSTGLKELLLHPKAMRLNSADLAERIKAVIAEANADLQRRISEEMANVFGEENNPMRFAQNPEGGLELVRQAEAAYNRTYEDLMGELDRIRQRMEG
ncbi:YbaB/EbfC family nucleoid-associated protein [Nonomuraea jabiensis]|uniref:Histidyl-tRNA synthetase n=1 Tax=Nonomuraea jabiensis TaxID=882448 RepID=A0A7W9G500_9ACTN|nr:YbaB/EbfC family nucleoid-associated protein [Nonomuraea jabiensis]MBB5777301.1 histidyl-tRNA synthetase [Nonomuraea jabiensis]